MARHARIKNLEEKEIYSVATNVNDNQPEFHKTPEAAGWFIETLKKFKKKYKFLIYAYEIMGTHIHLLIEPNKEFADISVIMREINGEFARRHNKNTGKTGHFWKERFSHKIVVGMGHLKRSIVYFLNNPVRAGLVVNPLEYKFTFAHSIIGQTNFIDPEGLIDFHLLPPEVISYVMNFINKFVKISKDGTRKLKKVSSKFLNKLKKIIFSIDFTLYKDDRSRFYRDFSASPRWVYYYMELWESYKNH